MVDARGSGLRITETDTYVVGQESYRTDLQVTNTGSQAVPARLYRAGDCYLGQDDYGYGLLNPATGLVACAKNPNNSPPGRLMEWDPVTPPDHYQQDIYYHVWSQIGTRGDLTDTCLGLSGTCPASGVWDNAAALQWNMVLQPGGSQTITHYTTFSPGGVQPLRLQKSADTYLVTPGSQDGYTLTVSNPNGFDVSLNGITDTLPSGFSYVSGSSTGVTTANPAGASTLTWSGPFTVLASGSISLHFNVTTASAPGIYCNSANADAGTIPVIPAENTACISTGPTPTPVVTVPPGPTPTPCVIDGQPCPTLTPGPTPSGKASCPTGGTPIPGCGGSPTPVPSGSGGTPVAVGGKVGLLTAPPRDPSNHPVGGDATSVVLLATGAVVAAMSAAWHTRGRRQR